MPCSFLTWLAGENLCWRRAVLVNFWATWCAPCMEEFPMIVDLGRDRRGEGLVVYFVSVDWLDQAEQVTAFLKRQGVSGLSFIKDEKDGPFIDGIAREWKADWAAPGLAVPGMGLSACSWSLLSQRRPVNCTWMGNKLGRDFWGYYLLYSGWRI